MTRARTIPSTRGFTLIELVTSLAISAILMTAMMSAVLVASQALPDDSDPAHQLTEGGHALRLIAEELSAARDITRAGASDIVFTLDDRDGDGMPQVVRYHWDGSAGDPLVRTSGGQSADVLAVDGFELTYRSAPESERVGEAGTTTLDQSVATYSDTGDRRAYNLTDVSWYGQTIAAPPTDGASTWRIARVRALLRQINDTPTSEDLYVEVYAVDGSGRPTGGALQSERVPLSSISNAGGGQWVEVTFASAAEIPAGDPVAIMYSADPGAGSALVRLYTDADAGGVLTHATGNAGGRWLDRTGEGPVHEVFGEWGTPGWSAELTRDRVHRVSIALTLDSGPALHVDAPMLNRPRVLTRVWEADFACDPTGLDLDMDGGSDWSVRSGSPFSMDDVASGRWAIRSEIGTSPAHDLDALTMIEAQLRNVVKDSARGGFVARFDADGSTEGVARVSITQDDAGQTLELELATAGGAFSSVYSAKESPETWVDLRLAIVPTHDFVALWVGGMHRGNFAYERAPASSAHGVYTTSASGSSGASVDRLRVEVGGSATVTSD